MSKSIRFCVLLVLVLSSGVFLSGSRAAQLTSTVASKHFLLQLPAEREALGRELLTDIERCYEFMDRSLDRKLPRKISVTVDWTLSESASHYRTGSLTIGMNHVAILRDEKGFLFHSIAREIGRLGLLCLSQGVQREDVEFLYEGMIEILVHEFDHSSRRLDAAWATAHLLDAMNGLGLQQQRSWTDFSGGKHNHRNAAPGITFLSAFRDLQARNRPLKFFESLRNNSLLNGLNLAFGAPAADLENAWLKKVRDYSIPDELTVKAGGAPQLLKAEAVPKAVQPGSSFEVTAVIYDADYDLIRGNIFLKDEHSGKVYQVQHSISTNEHEYSIFTIPVAPDCAAGAYAFQIIAIDESGNLRQWKGSYSVAAAQ